MIGRREFMRGSALGTAALLLARSARLASAVASSAPDTRIEVSLEEISGTISPNIYGHFIEHIGG
ncbi:MAG: alpha-L-arabinofuranosidase, partial [Candidatus Sulfotelmatobacter sp.]